jgi:hypothetical protein
MGNNNCTKIDDDDDDDTTTIRATATEIQDERNAQVISAGISQLKNNVSSSVDDPHKYFSGETFDSMSLANRLTFFPAHTETVMYSASVSKTNKRGKKQDRVWVLTGDAFYSFAAGEYGECKRRIVLRQISQLYINNSQTQMLIRVPRSYDYLCSADTTSVNALASILVRSARKAGEHVVQYIPCTEDDISSRCVTKGSGEGKWKAKRGRVR